MPSLLGTTVTANYLKAVNPFSQFGTRELQFIKVAYSGADTTPTIANSLFSQGVRALQQSVEVYFVGTPATGVFVAAIAADTSYNTDAKVAGGSDTGTGYNLIEAIMAAGITGNPTVTITALTASGASIA
jgi:hypothetical protein